VSLAIVSAAARPGSCTQCHLRHSTVCGAVPRTDLAELAAATSVLEIPAGTIFIEEDEPATDFFIITHGTATIFKLVPDEGGRSSSLPVPGG
jgi:CRP/FNR family transcriptional regulator